MKFTKDNYITIQGWMITQLELKGNELLLFALIYGFTQDGESEFEGTRKYMCSALRCTFPTVDKALKSLVQSKLIKKKRKNKNGVIFVKYVVSLQGVKKLYRGCKETLQGGCKETLHINNTSISNSINTKRKKDTKEISKYFKLATKLSEIIQSKKNIKHTKQQLNGWAVELKRLHTQNGVSPKRQKEVLEWYSQAIGGEFIPVTHSGKSFREKFDNLESAIQREQKKFTLEKGVTSTGGYVSGNFKQTKKSKIV